MSTERGSCPAGAFSGISWKKWKYNAFAFVQVFHYSIKKKLN